MVPIRAGSGIAERLFDLVKQRLTFASSQLPDVRAAELDAFILTQRAPLWFLWLLGQASNRLPLFLDGPSEAKPLTGEGGVLPVDDEACGLPRRPIQLVGRLLVELALEGFIEA